MHVLGVFVFETVLDVVVCDCNAWLQESCFIHENEIKSNMYDLFNTKNWDFLM